jgi:hypothetical protein
VPGKINSSPPLVRFGKRTTFVLKKVERESPGEAKHHLAARAFDFVGSLHGERISNWRGYLGQ